MKQQSKVSLVLATQELLELHLHNHDCFLSFMRDQTLALIDATFNPKTYNPDDLKWLNGFLESAKPSDYLIGIHGEESSLFPYQEVVNELSYRTVQSLGYKQALEYLNDEFLDYLTKEQWSELR